jgi:hypothetical protein
LPLFVSSVQPSSEAWSTLSDADLLCALAVRTGSAPDAGAVAELHRRHAPTLYALAKQRFQDDPEPHVQEALCFLIAQASCHARSALEARLWILAAALRSWAAQKGKPSTPLLAS